MPGILSVENGRFNGASEKLDPGQAEPQQILSNKGGDDESPQLVTLQCGLEIINPQAEPPGKIGVEGFIDWGISATSHSARFDWLQGCALTLTATSYKLRAKLRLAPNPGTTVMAKASVSYGSKPTIPFQLSSDHELLLPGASQILDIPSWATHGLLVVLPFDPLPLRLVRLELLTYDITTRYEVRPDDCTEANRFPLSFDVQKIRVTNEFRTRIQFCLIWRLAL